MYIVIIILAVIPSYKVISIKNYCNNLQQGFNAILAFFFSSSLLLLSIVRVIIQWYKRERKKKDCKITRLHRRYIIVDPSIFHHDFESPKFSALIRISSTLNDFQFLPSLNRFGAWQMAFRGFPFPRLERSFRRIHPRLLIDRSCWTSKDTAGRNLEDSWNRF